MTAPMIRAIHASWKDSATRNPFSASSLCGCPRRVILVHKLDYGADPAKEVAAMRGTLFHSMLERYMDEKNNERGEDRFAADFEGVEITGSPDFLSLNVSELVDYKTIEKLPPYKHPYVHHKIQINIYRWLLGQNGIQINRMIIQYLSMAGVKKCEAIRIPDEELEAMIRERVSAIKRGFENEDWENNLPPILDWKDIQCSWCPVKTQCYDLWKEGIINEERHKKDNK